MIETTFFEPAEMTKFDGWRQTNKSNIKIKIIATKIISLKNVAFDRAFEFSWNFIIIIIIEFQ